MSLMHDALKEMDKPRSEAGGAAMGPVIGMPTSASTTPTRARQDDTIPPTGTTALDWQAAKFNADARANARTAVSFEEESPKLNVTLIAWVLGGLLGVILAALWLVQSRQSQHSVPVTEGIVALTPPPKTVPAVQPMQSSALTSVAAQSLVASTQVSNDAVVNAPVSSSTSANISSATASPLLASSAPAAPPLVALTASLGATTTPLQNNTTAAPTMSTAPATVRPVAVVNAPSSSAAPVVAQQAALKPPVASVIPAAPKVAARIEVVAKDAPREMSRPRTAILSTTTLPAPPVVETVTPVLEPNANIEKKLANAALASTPVAATLAPPVALVVTAAPAAEAPRQPQLSAKPLAVQAAAAVAETKRKEALAQQTATARVAASQNASTRYAAIGRALDAGDRAAAQSQLSSLEQELPASSLTLLRARAWVIGTGSDMAAARSAYSAILARLPEDENALLNMAALETKDGKMDAARTFLAQALSANPESAAAKAAQQRISALTAQPR